MSSKFSDEQKIKTAKRLKALREEKGISHVTLSKELLEQCGLKISKDSLMKYEVSDVYHTSFGAISGMAAETLYCLAQYYNVSTDYLLAITDIQSIEPDMQAACKYTGLSEAAINNIKNLGNKTDSYYYDTHGFKPPLLKILNILFGKGFIADLLEAIGHCLYQIIVRDKFGSDRVLSIEEEQRITLPAIGYLNKEVDDEISKVMDILRCDLTGYYYGYVDPEDLP